MLSQRPFKDADEVREAAVRIWRDLEPRDWLEAFAAHPRIGATDRPADRAADGTATADWPAQEQAGMAAASGEVREAMARANREYEAKFGWIYLVCATGRTAEELLRVCQARLANSPQAELRVAAAEQERITRLRLERLLEP